MRSSNTSYLFQITDSSLTECLTKINRMDIVHLMESCVETSQDHGRTYAEIEQTIGLDHSEGKSEFSYMCAHCLIICSEATSVVCLGQSSKITLLTTFFSSYHFKLNIFQ